MTRGKEIGTGTSTEHKNAPCRTDTDCVAQRDEQPTLPDGMGSVYPAADEEVVASDSGAESSMDGQVAEPTLRAPFSGFWSENADIDGAVPDETEIRTRLYAGLVSGSPEDALADATQGSKAATDYMGPELDAAPRFVDDTELDATPLSPIEAELPGAADPAASAAPPGEPPAHSAQPTETPDEDVVAAVAEIVEELSDLLADGDASPASLEDSARDEPLPGSQTDAASQLLDADDDDLTDPQVPSARRISERPTPLVAKPSQDVTPAESVVPLAVSVTVRPTEPATEHDSEPGPVASRRLWLPAAIAGGVAAAAVGLVVVAASSLRNSGAAESAAPAHLAVGSPVADRVVPNPNGASIESVRPTPPVVEEPRSGAELGVIPPIVEQSDSVVGSSSTMPTAREPVSPASPESSSLPLAEQMRLAAAPDPSADEPPSVVAFDRSAAHAALDDLAANAAGCRQSGDPTGPALITVTFSPTTGRATQATVSGKPFQGTAIGGCIARVARQATVPPYTGAYVTVSKTIRIR